MSLGIHSEVDEQRSEVSLLWEIALDTDLDLPPIQLAAVTRNAIHDL
jgi:hypothetical protein